MNSSVKVFILFCVFITSCSAYTGGNVRGAPDFLPNDSARGVSTKMGVGDVFEVRVFGEAELSGIYRVASDGTISFPLIGKVQTVGLTVTELTDIITERLRDGFLKYPQVSIFVKEYNSKKIFVFGEVQKPGTFSYEEDMTIIQAITVAGGFTKTASKNKVSVTRLEEAIEKRVFLSVEEIGRGKEKNFFLLPGDIVFVPESIF